MEGEFRLGMQMEGWREGRREVGAPEEGESGLKLPFHFSSVPFTPFSSFFFVPCFVVL